MGIHKREREVEEIKNQYIKKSSCIMLVLLALFVGVFIGNTITMLYLGQGNRGVGSASVPVAKQQAAPMVDGSALARLEVDAEADPTSSEAWIKLGNFCFDSGLSEKAVMAYERALELSPMKVGVWSDLGVMYRRVKRYDKAIEAFQQAASLDSKHVTSRFNMGIVYLHDLNDRDNAVRVWKGLLVLDPNAKTPTGQSVAELVKELEK